MQRTIINGVDVTDCQALCCGNTCFLSRHKSFTVNLNDWCEENPQCVYKETKKKLESRNKALAEIIETEGGCQDIETPKKIFNMAVAMERLSYHTFIAKSELGELENV